MRVTHLYELDLCSCIKMNSNIRKMYIFGLLCLLLLTVESRPLERRLKAVIANSLRNKIGLLKTSLASRIKLLQLQREYRLMKNYYDSGLSLEEARKRVKTVDDVIADILNRNKIDNEKNPGM